MIRLFIELYTDEDVDVLIADLLRARGFNVLTTRDAGRLHATDEEQLAFAAAEHRTLLTSTAALCQDAWRRGEREVLSCMGRVPSTRMFITRPVFASS